MTLTYNDINYSNIVQGHKHFLQKQKKNFHYEGTYLAQYIKVSEIQYIFLTRPWATLKFLLFLFFL